MLKKILSNVILVFSFCLLSGCASMFQGANQNLTVATINDRYVEKTHCNIRNEEGAWSAAPNYAIRRTAIKNLPFSF